MATVMAYWRPTSVAGAIELLDRPNTLVIGGGTTLNARRSAAPLEVVDLQALGLDSIEPGEDDELVLGATTTLQHLVDDERVPRVVREAARRERPSTLRAQATIGGCVATGDWQSELLAALLVHDAVVRIEGTTGTEFKPLEAVLANLPLPFGRMVLEVTIRTSGSGAAERVGRTPRDQAIVSAYARRADGYVRAALSGVGPTPVLADEAEDLDPPGDFRGSTDYRRWLAVTLLRRVVEAVT